MAAALESRAPSPFQLIRPKSLCVSKSPFFRLPLGIGLLPRAPPRPPTRAAQIRGRLASEEGRAIAAGHPTPRRPPQSAPKNHSLNIKHIFLRQGGCAQAPGVSPGPAWAPRRAAGGGGRGGAPDRGATPPPLPLSPRPTPRGGPDRWRRQGGSGSRAAELACGDAATADGFTARSACN